jgi:hypothetical protein
MKCTWIEPRAPVVVVDEVELEALDVVEARLVEVVGDEVLGVVEVGADGGEVAGAVVWAVPAG